MRRSTLRQRGFTLIELMLVVSIFGTMIAIAAWGTDTWRRRNDLKRVTREIFNGLNRGRAEALDYGGTIKVYFSSQRMTVFRDADSDGVFDSGETAYYQYPIDPTGPLAGTRTAFYFDYTTWPTNMTIDASELTTANGTPTVLFDYYGFHINTSSAPLAAKVRVTDSQLGEIYDVEISVAGALRIKKI